MKAVLFDLDNTLVDFMKMKNLSCTAAIDAMIDAGLKISRKEGLETLYKLYDKYGIEHQQIFQKFLLKVLGKIDYRILAHGINAYRKVKEGFLVPYPGTKKTLTTLKNKGLKLAIISDAPKLQAWLRLTALGLDDFFDAVITFDDTKRKKPSRLPFRQALKALKLKPEDCLMVGDMPEKDIKGAKQIGMKTCFARYGYTEKPTTKTKADFEIDRIEELEGVV